MNTKEMKRKQIQEFRFTQAENAPTFSDIRPHAPGDLLIVPKELLPAYRVGGQGGIGDFVIPPHGPLPSIPGDSGWAVGIVQDVKSPFLQGFRQWLGKAVVPVMVAGCLYLLPVGLADVRAATFNVSSSAELSTAISTANANGEDDIVNINASIVLASELPLIDSNISFKGNGNSVSGNSTYRVFFVKSGTVVFRDMTISNGFAKGGDGKDGGGGGAGLGGGLFVYGGDVSVYDSTFSGNEARGGNGSWGKYGGGGGMGGDGSNSNYGGGGGLYTTDDALGQDGGGTNGGAFGEEKGGNGGFGGGGGGSESDGGMAVSAAAAAVPPDVGAAEMSLAVLAVLAVAAVSACAAEAARAVSAAVVVPMATKRPEK